MELYIRKVLKNRKRLVRSCYSLRGARFAKYRLLNLHILHFRCFIPSLGWNHLCIEWHIRKALKNRKRLVPSHYSLRSARFAKYRFLNLHILQAAVLFFFRLKSSLHQVVYTKSVKESEKISSISLQSSKRSFRKIQIYSFRFVSQNTVSRIIHVFVVIYRYMGTPVPHWNNGQNYAGKK